MCFSALCHVADIQISGAQLSPHSPIMLHIIIQMHRSCKLFDSIIQKKKHIPMTKVLPPFCYSLHVFDPNAGGEL